MFLKKITINRYRNFENTTVEFQDGVNIIVGPNNAGKTNLLRAINLLDNTTNSGTIHDFNKNNLYYNIEIYKNEPPTIQIAYYIQHELDFDNFDDGLLRLKNFIVYNDEGQLTASSEGKKYLINAEILLRFELDSDYLNEYKDSMKEVDNYKKFMISLERMLTRYRWSYYNATTQYAVNKSDVQNIFNIDLIKADRDTSGLIPHARNYVKKHLTDKTDTVILKHEITQMLGDKLADTINSISESIKKEEEDIGIKNGNSKIIPNFIFDTDFKDYFQFRLEDNDLLYEVPMDNNGLGYNNLIQIYSIIRFKIDNDYNILLIEEPEAHLHPAMQYKLLKYLSSLEEKDIQVSKDNPGSKIIKNQIFITTHSSNISAAANIDNMILLNYHRNTQKKEFNVESHNLKRKFSKPDYNDSKKHLAKFLDVTRSDMLFANKVILVEGLAEKLLMPLFAEKMGINYNVEYNHISIVEVGGINFNHFLPLFAGSKNKVLCFRDCDYKYFKEKDNEKKLNPLKQYKKFVAAKNKALIKSDFYTENIKALTQCNNGSTFENELIIDNFTNREIIKKLLKVVFPEKLNQFLEQHGLSISEWHRNVDTIGHARTKGKIKEFIKPYYIRYSELNNNEEGAEIEKLFFANLFLEYAENKKGDVALCLLTNDSFSDIIIPQYIQEGLKWLKQ